VQSVSPIKGRGKAGEPTDALLARAIVVPARTFAGLKLPSFGGSKRLPGGAALDRGGGAWRIIALLLIVGAIGYGVWWSGKDGIYGDVIKGARSLAVAAGFGVKRITIEGQQHVTDAELAAALGAGPGSMILAFDTDAAKERLEHVPFIRHAQVMRLLPSTLQVVIEERVPFAVWQSKGKTYVIDAEGTVLAPAVREAYADLPLVVGDGAEKHAAALVKTLRPFDELNQQLLAAIRVGDRRWNLKLTSGIDILLPDDAVTDALETLLRLDHERGLLKRDIAAVDLRLADRVSVRLAADPEPAAPEQSPVAPEVPTASMTNRKT
jgi:cell division protein FtsQ